VEPPVFVRRVVLRQLAGWYFKHGSVFAFQQSIAVSLRLRSAPNIGTESVTPDGRFTASVSTSDREPPRGQFYIGTYIGTSDHRDRHSAQVWLDASLTEQFASRYNRRKARSTDSQPSGIRSRIYSTVERLSVSEDGMRYEN